jgi:pimeloyl-ACP methyl ester carboxylesterase
VQEAGEGDPVLFVHGGPNGGSTFAPMIPGMRRRRSLILDRPGCGLSELGDSERIPSRSLAIDVIEGVLDQMKIDRIDLVGSSFGGAWALWFALARPDRVRRLVLLGAPAFVPGMLVPGFMRMLCAPLIGRAIAAMPPSVGGARWTFRQMGHSAGVVTSTIPLEYWNWGLRLMADTDTMANDVRVIRRSVSRGRVRPELTFAPADLQSLALPTLLYWGASDTFGGAALARSIAQLIPRAELEIVENGGHLPWLDDPDRAARSTSAFLLSPER